MPHLAVNGISINVELQGRGHPLLFVHGLGASLRTWDEEVVHFEKKFYTIAYDARGHGQSSKPPVLSLADHVADIKGIVDILGLPNLAIIGASMGSYIAQAFATQYPSLVSKLVLIVPKSNGKTSSTARVIAEHVAKLEGKSHRQKQEFLLDLAFAPNTPKVIRRRLIDTHMVHLLSEEEMQIANVALAGFDFRLTLPLVTAKALVICGKHDPLNPPQEAQVCAALIPGADYVEFDNSGHFPATEEPDMYYRTLDAFLF